jgi:hypothetical protein
MNTTTTCTLLALAGVALSVYWWRERRRSLALRQLASKLRFVYLGKALPSSLILETTGLKGISSCWNVIDGERNGLRILIFDCRIGEGKGSWRRTVVAAQGNPYIFRNVPFVLNLSSEQTGDWTVLYQPKSFGIYPPGLMATTEIEALLQLLGSGENALPLTS